MPDSYYHIKGIVLYRNPLANDFADGGFPRVLET
jgi:hypothetical protein